MKLLGKLKIIAEKGLGEKRCSFQFSVVSFQWLAAVAGLYEAGELG
jgi:hypothetical protein